MTRETLLWVVLPYAALAVFVVGHVWRWRHDQFGWTTHTSQVLESRILRWGSPLFHLGAFAVIAGHAAGLLVPKGVTEALGVSESAYHWGSLAGGSIAGLMLVVGLALLVARRFVSARVRRVTTASDRVLYVALGTMTLLGMATKVANNVQHEHGYDYRETVSVWYRGVFYGQPEAALMTDVPVLLQLHALGGFLFLALWPFTRLVHVWSAPMAYLWRPYVIYRRRSSLPAPVRVAGRREVVPGMRPSPERADRPAFPGGVPSPTVGAHAAPTEETR